MIISASRRTDIPCFYHKWFFNRLEEGFVLVRNPMNIHQISKVKLTPDVVDGLVFWTKNPEPMVKDLDRLKKYVFYFQFTLTAYGQDVERNIPSKRDSIIPIFKKLSQKIGKERVVWRYDPIFFTKKYTFEYHCEYFKKLCTILHDYTDRCTVSFLDLYQKTERNSKSLHILNTSDEQRFTLMREFANIASKYNVSLDSCAENINFQEYGIQRAHCIHKEWFEKIGSFQLSLEKDKNQRALCGCLSSIDIGSYNTCNNSCLYCYANFNSKVVRENISMHDPFSPLLFGHIGEKDIVTERKVTSYRSHQLSFFGK